MVMFQLFLSKPVFVIHATFIVFIVDDYTLSLEMNKLGNKFLGTWAF
ncbi:hypothetical protein HNV12_13790 [Methanococcoides sp. SA1]|nr:hypothetical protein [Methanococcoides sp. SA1]